MKIWCDTCKHSKVCLGKSLYKQFKAEVDIVSDKYTEETKHVLITFLEEWFRGEVSCRHYLGY